MNEGVVTEKGKYNEIHDYLDGNTNLFTLSGSREERFPLVLLLNKQLAQTANVQLLIIAKYRYTAQA